MPVTAAAAPAEGPPSASAAPAAEVRSVAVGKSSILLDVKPWDVETDMRLLEEAVRSVQKEGLTWGASKAVPVAHGIKKLQVLLTIVDDLVSIDDLIEYDLCAEPRNEYIQSCDIVAFNKICKCHRSRLRTLAEMREKL